MDKVLAECSFHGMIKQVENICVEYFNCERASLILIHRFKKYMFRIEKTADVKGSVDLERKQYEMN